MSSILKIMCQNYYFINLNKSYLIKLNLYYYIQYSCLIGEHVLLHISLLGYCDVVVILKMLRLIKINKKNQP